MPGDNSKIVRPTRRALGDLGIPIPDLGQPLHEIDHAVIKDVQRMPDVAAASGLERVLALVDRVWFKYKSGRVRGVVTRLYDNESDQFNAAAASLEKWWAGAFGFRQADSPKHDFYDRLKTEAAREAKTRGTQYSTCSEHLLPTEWDLKRLATESALVWRRVVKGRVLEMIAKSLRHGGMYRVDAGDHYITAGVKAVNRDEAYLVIGAVGMPDPDVIAGLLDCVPGVPHDDWQWEPIENVKDLGIQPRSGELAWSTLFSPEVQAAILEAVPED